MQDDHQGSEFVYDFLYQDVRRVGSILSQFVESGHLQGIKQINAKEESEHLDVGGNLGADAKVVRAQGQLSRRAGSGTKDGMERTYDPIWTNAIDLLTFLNERDMLQRDVRQAHTGQFVMAKGTLGIIDLALLQTIWGIPIFRDLAERALTPGLQKSHTQGSQSQNQSKSDATKVGKGSLDLISKLPHSIQARLATDDGSLLYCPIQADGLTITSTDLILKNGTFVPGEWGMLGILDSFADTVEAEVAKRASEVLGLSANPFTRILEAMTPLVRNLGRPADALGITPLLIFREVNV